jgi:ABC-type methionine transport system permease subunit
MPSTICAQVFAVFLGFIFHCQKQKQKKKPATYLLITALFDCIKSPSFLLILVTLRILLLAEEIFCIALS